MIPDVNVLLYGYDTTSERHERCNAWLTAALNGEEEVGFSFIVVLGFLRIATHPGVWTTPMSVTTALGIVDTWLTRPNTRLIQPGARYWSTLHDLAIEADARGSLLMDAHLAALAGERGATLVSTDRDLRRFRGVRLLDPTA